MSGAEYRQDARAVQVAVHEARERPGPDGKRAGPSIRNGK